MDYNRYGLPKATVGLPGKRIGELACSLSADLYADGDMGVFPFAHAASRAAVHSGMAYGTVRHSDDDRASRGHRRGL